MGHENLYFEVFKVNKHMKRSSALSNIGECQLKSKCNTIICSLDCFQNRKDRNQNLYTLLLQGQTGTTTSENWQDLLLNTEHSNAYDTAGI